jgi:hypothetical protein
MHLFLYKSARHSNDRWGHRSRYKQGTIRGDFDLEMLKRGIRGRFKILPHGEHEFQKALENVDLLEEFYGHVVQIEEARNAVWFKLNYDQVGKNTTTYHGGWRDLRAQDISSHVTSYLDLQRRHRALQGLMSNIKGYHYSSLNFTTRLHGDPDTRLDAIKKELNDMTAQLTGLRDLYAGESQELMDQMKSVQDEVRAYMKERSLG